jgi:outer membrane receptor protein involved in Fe transport
MYDASLGVAKDSWSAEAYAENLTNVVTSTWTSTAQFSLQQEITRPRVLGVRIGYKF